MTPYCGSIPLSMKQSDDLAVLGASLTVHLERFIGILAFGRMEEVAADDEPSAPFARLAVNAYNVRVRLLEPRVLIKPSVSRFLER